MGRKILGILLSLSMLLALLPTAAFAAEETMVTIYATNDIHGVVEESDSTIGLAQVSAITFSQQDAILVDAGDATQGASFATVNKGGDVIRAMNAAAYTLMAAGNHEFDYGMDQLLANAEAANFPILSANMTYNGEHVLKCHEIINREDKSIGFIGLTTTATISNANPAGLAGVKFEDEITAAKREIAEIDDETDAIVLICHMGNDEAAVETTSKDLLDGLTDDELAKVTAVIDGHSHTVEDGTPYVRGDVSIPVIQTGTQLTALGYVALTFSGDTVSARGGVMDYDEIMGYTPIEDFAGTFPLVKETVAGKIAEIQEGQKAILGETLCRNAAPLWGGYIYYDYVESRIVETAYGDFVTDAFVNSARAFAENSGLDLPVIAVENGGGIGQTMPMGTVTRGDVLDAFNHGNLVVAMSVTPAQLYTALEVGLTMTGQDDTGLLVRERVSGSFLQVSGFTYTYDPAGKAGAKVTEVTLDGGKKLSRDDTTTQLLLATNNYVATFDGLKDGRQLGELGGEDLIVEEYLLAQTDYGERLLEYPITQGRIQIANDKSPETYDVSVPVLSAADKTTPLAGQTFYLKVDGGEYTEVTTDADGVLAVENLAKGPHTLYLREAGGQAVYVNNYSGSGTVTTKEGYYRLGFLAGGELPFADVSENAWYRDAAAYVYQNGLMAGVSDTAFGPSDTTSRAMVVQVLWSMEQKPAVDFLLTYSDVAEGQWYAEAVRWASSEQVVSGFEDNTFRPNAPVTREQLAVMLFGHAKSQGLEAVGQKENLSSFPDAGRVSSYAVQAMNWAVGQGLFAGKDGGRLDPQGQTTRAELAQVLMQYTKLG